MSILDVAARSVAGDGGHKSKAMVAALMAVLFPTIAALSFFASDADSRVSLILLGISLPVSAFCCVMYFAHRRYWGGELLRIAPESASEVKTLTACVALGAVLTVLALVLNVGAIYVVLAAVATVATAVSLLFELRKGR